MGVFRKIDRILGALGNIRALERTHVDTYTEDLIQNVSGQKIAESIDGQLWVDFQELAGYNFLEATILSRENIKTFNGGRLVFNRIKEELVLDSDITEIESDYSNVSKRWMTKVSFIITKDNIKFIEEKSLILYVLNTRKNQLHLK